MSTDSADGPRPPAPEHPGLLPGYLREDPAGDPGRRPRRSARDWAVDVIGFGLALLLGGVYFASQTHSGTAVVVWVLDLSTGIAACVSLWWRRRQPVAIAMVTGVISAFSAMSAIAALVALFTVAVHRPSRTVAVVGAVQVAAGLAYIWVRPGPDGGEPIDGVLAAMFVLATIAWGMFVRARRQLLVSLRDRAQRAEAEQSLRVDQARQLERTRIAREMHDVLAHRISMISLHAGALEFRSDAFGEEVTRSAAVIRSSAHQALEELREVIGLLRSETDDDAPSRPQPTLADVPQLVAESQRAGMPVVLEFGLDGTAAAQAPLSIGRTAYRIVQEGLTNVRKHAPGTRVIVRITGSPGAGVQVEVANHRPADVGQHPSIPGAGQGLVGLAERANLAGGRLEHGPTFDGGFRLAVRLPWPDEPSPASVAPASPSSSSASSSSPSSSSPSSSSAGSSSAGPM
jgi:signal transduction histidine kinase